jgi:AP-1 complex subunit beta-1
MAYFANNRRGEIPELQEELNSVKHEQKKEAVKKVIAAMTVGKDVSALFPHVVKCMEIPNVELKKLIYLYIINYAKTQPDLAIMAVNSFRKDAKNPTSPLIRALAVRTMGCIRVERITEYLCEPLKEALRDEDPYVRKTAAICVSKLYDIAPELVEDTDFLNILASGLNDGNALVLSNTVAAITEISEMRGSQVVALTPQIINRVLSALNEATEWGQVFILDYIGTYTPTDSKECESIIERIIPRLAHANPAVVLSTIKVIIKYLDLVTAADVVRSTVKKVSPSIVSLINSEPEIQYVALRCINLIVQKRPNILDKEVRVFFCKYNDPIYVKMEKLEIIVRMTDSKNIDQVLHELKDYSTEIDVEFVKKAIQAIGRCAIKLEKTVDKCVNALIDLVKMKVQYAVQEILIVMKDIFRRYPNRFEMVIKDLFNNIEDLDNPESKSAFIWILGEYAEKIDDAEAQLKSQSENFKDEELQVQLQILTAVVKLFLKKPDQGESLITDLLKIATEECPNPDLRDRAYVYWRLLSTDPEATKKVVLCEKPLISEVSYIYESSYLDKLIDQLGTIASVYHKVHETKLSKIKAIEKEEAEKEDIEVRVVNTPNLLDQDLLSVDGSQRTKAKVPMQIVLSSSTPGINSQTGLQIEMAFQKEDAIVLETKFTNYSQVPLTDFAMQFNVNYFGLALQEPLQIDLIQPSASATVKSHISTSGQRDSNIPGVPLVIQIAIRCSLDVFYFQTPCMFTVLLTESGLLSKEDYKSQWKSIPEDNEFTHTISNVHISYNNVQSIQDRLVQNLVFLVASRKNDENEDVMYFSSQTHTSETILTELRIPQNISRVSVACKALPYIAPLFIQAINFLLSTNN